MRTFLWTLIQKYFSQELKSYTDSFKENHYRELEKTHAAKRVYANYPIGKKVIVRSNEPDDLFIGKVTGYWVHEKSQQVFLIITDESGKEISPMDNSPFYWTKEREAALRKLSWDEQWNCLSKYHSISKQTKLSKESPEYRAEALKFKEQMETQSKA